MRIQDDRTPEQRATHQYLVIGTDRFMSGWGKAEGGASYAAWACGDYAAMKECMEQVERRSDMRRVRDTIDTPTAPYRPKGRGHCHIYVWRRGQRFN